MTSVKDFSEPKKMGLKARVEQFLKGVGLVPLRVSHLKKEQKMKSFLLTFLVS